MAHYYLNNGGTRWVTDNKIRVVGDVNGKQYNKMHSQCSGKRWETLLFAMFVWGELFTVVLAKTTTA